MGASAADARASFIFSVLGIAIGKRFFAFAADDVKQLVFFQFVLVIIYTNRFGKWLTVFTLRRKLLLILFRYGLL